MELTLALLEARVLLVNDVDTPLAADDLAVRGAAFDGGAYFHVFSSEIRFGTAPGADRANLSTTSRGGTTLSNRRGNASDLLNFFMSGI